MILFLAWVLILPEVGQNIDAHDVGISLMLRINLDFQGPKGPFKSLLDLWSNLVESKIQRLNFKHKTFRSCCFTRVGGGHSDNFKMATQIMP